MLNDTSLLNYDNILSFCNNREDLSKRLIKAIPESYADKGLSLLQRVEKYNLPDNPNLQSLSIYQTRIWYKWQESLIEIKLDYSQPLETVAK